MSSSILVIEDDGAFRKELVKLLVLEGFTVRSAATGKSGLSETVKESPSLVILDLGLPGLDGRRICRSLKDNALTAGIPVLILTGQDEEGQEISCLDMGADDYLTKPVDPKRLLARCRALIRRHRAADEATAALKLKDLELDHAGKAVILAGRRITHLTPKEFGVLYDLALHSPRPLDQARLYQEVWGIEAPSAGSLKTVEVHVRRIRLKMDWRPDRWLVTIKGRGYALIPPE